MRLALAGAMISAIDPMDNAAQWSALEPDGVTPSTELTVSNTGNQSYLGADQTSMSVTGTAAAAGHTIRRNLAGAVDASTWPELALAIRADRLADGSSSRPFYLQLRLGSAAMGLADAGNVWHRYLPVQKPNTWTSLRFSLDDLPVSIRSAIDAIEITCRDASRSFACHLDDFILVHDRTLFDIDVALFGRLHQTLALAAPVPALRLVTGSTLPALPRPAFALANYRYEWDESRSDLRPSASDYTDNGFRMRPDRHAFVARYAVLALADDRDDQTALLDFACQALPPRDALVINDYRGDLWHIATPSFHELPWPGVYPQIHLAALNWSEVGTVANVRAAQNVRVETETLIQA